MRNETKRSKLFARRALMLGAGKSALMLGLASRLYYLQIMRANEYKTLSDSNRIRLFLIPPLRGTIYDRFGTPVSTNQIDYRIFFDPHESDNKLEVLNHLADLLDLKDPAREYLLKRLHNHAGPQPVLLKEHLTWEEVSVVEVNAPDLPGITIEAGHIRYYPYRNIMANLIGYVGAVSEAEQTKQPLLAHPDFKIGKSGIEKAYEYQLRGEAGVRHMEVNAYGLTIRELAKEDSQPGQAIKMAIDARLQEFAYNRLSEQPGGSAIVIDTESGDVLAMCSTPNFDPNKFVNGISSRYWNELLNDPHLPLINKPIAQLYPPGSTFKPMTALALLSQGVDPNKTVYCPGYYSLGNRQFHCWKAGGHGHLTMQQAIMHSCNVYFYTMSKSIGVEPITEMAERFGLGAPTGIEIPGEKSGVVPSNAWKKKQFSIPWQTGDTLNTSIGQGFNLVTPLQLAVMVSRLASRGKKVTPHLVLDSSHSHKFDQMDIPDKHFDIVLGGMENVMNTPGGTAYGSRIINPAFRMAGKTGTAQVISRKRLENNAAEAHAWYNQNHALFICFAPTFKPKYAAAIVVDHGKSGSGTAAPIGRDLLQKAQELRSGEPVEKTKQEEV